jgi:hypothetical protein
MNVNAGGSFLGNLLMGIYQGQQAQTQQQAQLRAEELKNEMIKAQVDLHKSQTKQMQIKEENEARKHEMIAPILQRLAVAAAPPQQPVAAPQQQGPQFVGFPPDTAQAQPGAGVTDMMAAYQGLGPAELAVLKDSGLDLVPGINAVRGGQSEKRQREEFDYKKEQDNLKNWMQSQEVILVPQQDASGAVRQVPQFKNPAAAAFFAKSVQKINSGQPMGGSMSSPTAAVGGGGMPSSVPKPETRKEVKEGITYAYEVNPFNQQEVPGTRRVEEGVKPLSGETAGRLSMIDSSLDSLYQANAILMPGGELRKDWKQIAFVGNMPSPLNAVNPEAREWNSHMRNAKMSKIRIETGANMPITEEKDLDARFMPSALDSDKLAKSKLNNLERFMNGAINLYDPNKQYSKETFIFKADNGKKYAWEPGSKVEGLPKEAIKSLKPEVLTTFGNGQVWTIENGKPVRKK